MEGGNATTSGKEAEETREVTWPGRYLGVVGRGVRVLTWPPIGSYDLPGRVPGQAGGCGVWRC